MSIGHKYPRSVSIIVPTYKEVLNIQPSIEQIHSTLQAIDVTYEIIFVDDNSNDGSIELLQKLEAEFNYAVRMIVRTKERGLSSAVLRGFDYAKYDTLLVMDADLQHNPKYIPALILPIINGEADFSIGSRHAPGGGIVDWPVHHRLLSWAATLIARPLIPCTDPMSGFFALSKDTLKRAKVLNPGYKIGLELMTRCDVQRIAEVPIMFESRAQNPSKLSFKTNALHLLHISQLYMDCKPQYVFLLALCVLILITFIGKKMLFAVSPPPAIPTPSYIPDSHHSSHEPFTRSVELQGGMSHFGQPMKYRHDEEL